MFYLTFSRYYVKVMYDFGQNGGIHMQTTADKERKRINYLTNEIYMTYHTAAQQVGLSDSELEILYTLCDEGDRCPQKTIYQKTGSRRSTINSAIRKLERSGALYLEASDGRSTLVCLTEKGRQLVKEKALPLLLAENAVFEEWTAKEREEYMRLTEKYLDSFRAKVLAMSPKHK